MYFCTNELYKFRGPPLNIYGGRGLGIEDLISVYIRTFSQLVNKANIFPVKIHHCHLSSTLRLSTNFSGYYINASNFSSFENNANI